MLPEHKSSNAFCFYLKYTKQGTAFLMLSIFLINITVNDPEFLRTNKVIVFFFTTEASIDGYSKIIFFQEFCKALKNIFQYDLVLEKVPQSNSKDSKDSFSFHTVNPMHVSEIQTLFKGTRKAFDDFKNKQKSV